MKNLDCYIILTVSALLCDVAHALKDPFDLKATLTLEDARRVSYAKTRPQASTPPSDEQRLLITLPINLKLKDMMGYSLGEVTLLGLFIKEDEDLSAGTPIIEDFHAYSNIRAEDRVQLFEVFWSKRWANTTVRIGKLDANDHFAVSEHEAHLINGAAGFSPSIIGMPSYPDAAWSIQAEQHIGRFDLSVGIFDGASTTITPRPTGALFRWSDQVSQGDLFYVSQLTAHLGEGGELISRADSDKNAPLSPLQHDRDFGAKAPVQLTLGAWAHRGDVTIVNGVAQNASGLYMTSDVELMRLPKGGELGLGFQLAISSAVAPLHASFALTWDELTRPLAWATRGTSLAIGASFIALEDGSGAEAIDGSESLLEVTLCAPLSSSLQLSASYIYLSGDHLRGAGAHLMVTRLTIGSF